MAKAIVNGVTVSYEIIGEPGGRRWALTPGGRYSKDDPGVRELAQALADRGNQVLIWDRPNCGESDVCFEGETESAMQADVLAGLITQLEFGPCVVFGGSGGSRISMLAVGRHPEIATALAIWWISGGIGGLVSVGNFYCGANLHAAWTGTMADVADLPEWAESITRNPGNRDRILAQDRATFIATFERWLAAYCPPYDKLVPGLSESEAANITVPTLVFRSGESDFHHTRETSELIAKGLSNATLVEPPWGDREWQEVSAARNSGEVGGVFVRWPLLAPQLHEWAEEVWG